MKKLLTLVALLTCFMGAKAQDEPVYSIDYSTYSGFPFYVMGYVPEWVGGVMTDYGAMYGYKTDTEMLEGDFNEVGTVTTNSGVTYHKVLFTEAAWHQYFIADGIKTTANGSYTVKAMVKASQEVTINVNMGWGWGSGEQKGASVKIGTDWAEVTWKYQEVGGTSCNLVAQPGGSTATIEWKWVKVYTAEPVKPIEDYVWTDIIENDTRFFRSKESPSTVVLPSKIEEGVYVVNSPVQVSDPWDSQFWIRMPQTLEAGKKFKIAFDYKASAAATAATQCHAEPGNYIHWLCLGDINFTEGWQTFENTVTVPAECKDKDFRSIAFNLSQESTAIDYYFKNIKVEIDEDDVAAEFDYPDPIYTVAGTEDLCGTAWNNRANVMEYDAASGLFMWGAKEITVNNDNKPEFKVVKDCNWDTCWPESNWVITPEVLGGEDTYNIIITFNAETNVIAVLNEDLLAEAENLAIDESAVAVGKLLAAIEAYKGNGNFADLQAAINQFKADNAPLEADVTSQFPVDYQGWSGATGFVGWAAPTVTTNDGRSTAACERYESTCANTGDVFTRTLTGLTNGTYRIELYGAAAFTSGRGFESELVEGDETAVYLYAETAAGTVKQYIPAHVADNFNGTGIATAVLDGVVISDGTVKLGMYKDKAYTNWHVVQIKGVTALALAKDLYATCQAELTELVEEGQALAADEYKTVGKEEFSEVLAVAEEATTDKKNWYNVPEAQQIVADLKAAIANFKKANWFIDFAAGEYYIIEAESGLKMAAGNDYGTRGIVNEMGLDLTLTPYEESRTVTIDSRVSNGGNNHFLSSNLYMDSSEWGWALEYRGFGFYILEPVSGKYINVSLTGNNLELSETPCEWIIVSKEGVREELLGEMADANKDNPVDATGLIVAQNFNRNDARNAEAWIVSEDCTNKNLSGGNQANNCAESYHSTFTIMQTIQGAPAGFYQLTAQGFYRQDDFEGEAPAAPVFFANGINGNVPALAEGGPNGMDTASQAFTNGDYTIEPINFEVKEDGMMYIGITQPETNTQWVIWDNFRLMFFGQDNPTTGIATVNTSVNQNAAGIYNLNGQRVMNAQKGLYIMNGKKVVVK